MLDPLQGALRVSSASLRAQSVRLRVVSENLANAESTGASPGATPYTRKTVTLGDEFSRKDGLSFVAVRRIAEDTTPYRVVKQPGNPAADADGNVLMPNVEPLVEIADMKEANRVYEASLQTFKQARDLISMTIDLLKT